MAYKSPLTIGPPGSVANLHPVLVDASDESGNRVPLVERWAKRGRGVGFSLPGGSKSAEVRLRVERNDTCPVAAGDCFMIAEGGGHSKRQWC